MPPMLRTGPYRFFFYSSDRGEPPHVRAERDNNAAKFFLKPDKLERSRGFNRQKLRRIEGLILEGAEGMLRSWNEYFNN